MSASTRVILLMAGAFSTAASRDGLHARTGVRGGSFAENATLALWSNQSAGLREADVSQTLAETEFMLSQMEVRVVRRSAIVAATFATAALVRANLFSHLTSIPPPRPLRRDGWKHVAAQRFRQRPPRGTTKLRRTRTSRHT